MMRRSYILAEIQEADGSFVRQVLPTKSVCNVRWNAASTAHLTVRDSHPAVADLAGGSGMRAVVWMVQIDGGTLFKHRLVDGRIGNLSGDEAPYGTVTIPVVDDFQNFGTLLGFQVPTAGTGGQGAREYARYTGPSETRAKQIIAENKDRLGLPWDVTPSRGRGRSATTEMRMHAMSDKIIAPLTADRLQLTLKRSETDPTRFVVDVVGGDAFPRPITPQSGVLKRWSWTQQPATATRAIVGGRGEGVERVFAQVIDADLEARMGVALETFIDARNTDEGTDLVAYGRQKLAELGEKAGIRAELRETSWFRFPDGYDIGTRVNIQIGTLQVNDVITEIEISHDANAGFAVVPTVGLATRDPQQRFVGFVKDVATAVRGMERG